MPSMRWVTIDLALRAVQDIELLAGLIAHFLEEWVEGALIFFSRNKINVGIFARDKFTIIPAFHTHSQAATGEQKNRLFGACVDQAIHFIKIISLDRH